MPLFINFVIISWFVTSQIGQVPTPCLKSGKFQESSLSPQKFFSSHFSLWLFYNWKQALIVCSLSFVFCDNRDYIMNEFPPPKNICIMFEGYICIGIYYLYIDSYINWHMVVLLFDYAILLSGIYLMVIPTHMWKGLCKTITNSTLFY